MNEELNLNDWKRRLAELFDAYVQKDAEREDGDAEADDVTECYQAIVAHLRTDPVAQQPATPAVPRKTNRELHESAAGMNLSDSFFSHSGIDPDGYPPDSVTAPAVPDGFALVEVAVIDDEWLAVAMRDADIVRRVCADDSVVISAAINAYLLAASRKDAAQKPAPANGDGQ